MNSTEARFLKIRRFSEEELSSIHDAERADDLLWREFPNSTAKRGDGWLIAGSRKMNDIDRMKPPFWNAKITEDERTRSVNVFLHDKAVKRAFKMSEDFEKTEMEAVHSADWYVWKNAPMVGAQVGDAVKERLKGVY